MGSPDQLYELFDRLGVDALDIRRPLADNGYWSVFAEHSGDDYWNVEGHGESLPDALEDAAGRARAKQRTAG